MFITKNADRSRAQDKSLACDGVESEPAGGENAIASGLPLQQGWNHFLVKLVHTNGDDSLSAKLISSDPAFLDALHSALQKP